MSHLERNAPCPCGSGKKYKKCCLGTEQDPAREQAPLPVARAAARAPADALGEDFQWMSRAAALLSSGEKEPLTEAFDAIARMLGAGGPLAHLRYLTEAFV